MQLGHKVMAWFILFQFNLIFFVKEVNTFSMVERDTTRYIFGTFYQQLHRRGPSQGICRMWYGKNIEKIHHFVLCTLCVSTMPYAVRWKKIDRYFSMGYGIHENLNHGIQTPLKDPPWNMEYKSPKTF